MKQEELTKIFRMILNLEDNHWSPWFIPKYFSAVRIYTARNEMNRALGHLCAHIG